MRTKAFFFAVTLTFCFSAQAGDILVKKISTGNDFFEKPLPAAAQWAEVQATEVALLPQNITTPSLTSATVGLVKVKAVHNGDWMAIRLEWPDATKEHQLTTDQTCDAAAIQFPLKEADKTSPFMGAKDTPVGIMQWKAVWQHDLEKGYQKVTDVYPNTYYQTHDFGIKAAQLAGNSVSQQDRQTPVEEYVAAGFGSLTAQKHQDGRAGGSWQDGKWVVVFSRPLKNSDRNDPQFKAGDKSLVAFAVWEGAGKNVGARKNYAMWTPIIFGEK